MPRYTVYPTRWDGPHIVEEIVPARGLEFTMPVSDHGECSFSATVEPGGAPWRAAIAPLASGVIICRDDVPVWSGMVWSERQTGPRTFDFQAAEWGSFYERVPAQPYAYVGWNDHAIFRNLISRAVAAASGRDISLQLGSTLGASTSDLTINSWDDLTVEAAFTQVATAAGGPEWRFTTSGTLENPVRALVLADRMGRTDARAVLEYVESTVPAKSPQAPPQLTTLGNLFPSDQRPQNADGSRRGGNVIAHPARVRDGASSATEAIAIGAGQEKAQLRRTATSGLIGQGYPRLTKTAQYNDVTSPARLLRHAQADVAAVAGLVTSYTFTTYDDDPDWTQVQPGDTVRCILDTDVYGAERPVEFEARAMGIAVQVQDDGPALVNWTVATTLES